MMGTPPSRGEKQLLCLGVLLAANLVLVPWHRIRIGLGEQGRISIDKRALDAPNAGFGIVALLVLVVLLIVVAGRVRSGRRYYTVDQLRVLRLGGAVVLGVLVAKLALNSDFLGPGAWLGVVFAGAMAYSTLVVSNEFAEGNDPGQAG